jgi:hypothetical protein
MLTFMARPPVMLDVDPEVKQVVYPCLSADYTQRPTASELLTLPMLAAVNEAAALEVLSQRVRASKYEEVLPITRENLLYQWVT